jgi:hypothetical protein
LVREHHIKLLVREYHITTPYFTKILWG